MRVQFLAKRILQVNALDKDVAVAEIYHLLVGLSHLVEIHTPLSGRIWKS